MARVYSYVKRTDAEWAWSRLGLFCRHFDVDPVTNCWLWRGNINKNGYGMFQQLPAHRWAWLEFEGPIPPKMTVDHLCRKQNCVNPGHMELVTNAENAGRALRRRLAMASILEWSWMEPDFANVYVGKS